MERVAEAFKLILSAETVKAIFVNIFGGIVRCDMIAEGIIAAVKDVGVTIPVVVRLEGTNVEAGKELLRNSGLAIIAAADITDGAKKAVAAAAYCHSPTKNGVRVRSEERRVGNGCVDTLRYRWWTNE